jgi:hypothetical protein
MRPFSAARHERSAQPTPALWPANPSRCPRTQTSAQPQVTPIREPADTRARCPLRLGTTPAPALPYRKAGSRKARGPLLGAQSEEVERDRTVTPGAQVPNFLARVEGGEETASRPQHTGELAIGQRSFLGLEMDQGVERHHTGQFSVVQWKVEHRCDPLIEAWPTRPGHLHHARYTSKPRTRNSEICQETRHLGGLVST